MTVSVPPLAAAALAEAEAAIAAGRLQQGAEALKRARLAAPTAAEVPHRAAEALTRRGERQHALGLRFAAYRLAPGELRYRHALVRALAGVQLGGASPAIVEAGLQLLEADDISPQDVAPALFTILLARPAVQHLLRLDAMQLEAVLPQPETQTFLADPLWLALQVRALQTFTPVERFLTNLRRLALARLARPDAPPGLVAADPAPLAALACQASHGAHAWAETPEEEAAVEALAARLAAAPPTNLTAPLLLLAAYRRLPSWAWSVAPAGDRWLKAAHQRLIAEPRRQAELAAALPSLTPLEDATSTKVRAQYEANPYPRWLATNRLPPRPLREAVQALLPGMAAESLPDAAQPEILVAGCGTGQHAVRVASRYQGAWVLALDLSRASLAYAQLRAEQLGIGNLRFAQADLLRLGGIEERFDLIECVGVLHHLKEPLAGWRVLTGLLKPKGLLRIGLYSRLARRGLPAARARAGLTPEEATPAALRRARTQLLAAAGTPAADAAMRGLDFYDLDGLRDLLFHVQETEYDCPRLAAELAELDLDFLGFEMPAADTRQRFSRRFPDAAAERDLACWDAFEQDNPDTFAGMYLFWCRPRG